MPRTRKYTPAAPILVCGIILRPVNGSWMGRINSHRFTLRADVCAGRKVWNAFKLPILFPPEPLASGDMSDCVLALVELWKYRLPSGGSVYSTPHPA